MLKQGKQSIDRRIKAEQERLALGVQRVVRWFDTSTDALVGSAPLNGVPLAELQNLFNVDSANPMFDCFPIGPVQARQLQPYLDAPIQLDLYEYFVEADATESAR